MCISYALSARIATPFAGKNRRNTKTPAEHDRQRVVLAKRRKQIAQVNLEIVLYHIRRALHRIATGKEQRNTSTYQKRASRSFREARFCLTSFEKNQWQPLHLPQSPPQLQAELPLFLSLIIFQMTAPTITRSTPPTIHVAMVRSFLRLCGWRKTAFAR